MLKFKKGDNKMAGKRESVSKTTVFILVVVMLAVSVLTSLTLIMNEVSEGAAKVKTEVVASGLIGLNVQTPGSESGRVTLTVIEPI